MAFKLGRLNFPLTVVIPIAAQAGKWKVASYKHIQYVEEQPAPKCSADDVYEKWKKQMLRKASSKDRK